MFTYWSGTKTLILSIIPRMSLVHLKTIWTIGVYLYNTVSEFLNAKEGMEKRKSSNEEVTEKWVKLFPKVMELCYDPSSL